METHQMPDIIDQLSSLGKNLYVCTLCK